MKKPYRYHCRHCSETIIRFEKTPPRMWIKSHCKKTGKNGRLTLVKRNPLCLDAMAGK